MALGVPAHINTAGSTTSTPEVTTALHSDQNDAIHHILSLIQNGYAPYHGYVSIGVCVVGSICSVLVVAVLTRRQMMSATSFLLAALAVSDLLTMLVYVPFALQFYCLYGVQPSRQRDTKSWAYFCLFYANFSVTTHTVSIWIGVVLAAYRYRCVRCSSTTACGGGGASRKGGGGRRSVSRRSAAGEESLTFSKLSLVCIVAGSALILLPNYVSLGVRESNSTQLNATLFTVEGNSELPVLNTVNFWIHALLVKLLPCALMSVFGGLLLIEVSRLHRRRLAIHQTTYVKQPLLHGGQSDDKKAVAGASGYAGGRVCLKQKSVETVDLIGETKPRASIAVCATRSRFATNEIANADATQKTATNLDIRTPPSIPSTAPTDLCVQESKSTSKNSPAVIPTVNISVTPAAAEPSASRTISSYSNLASNINADALTTPASQPPPLSTGRSKSFSVANSASDRAKARKTEHQRTTGMLCAVLVLFLVTELPQGMLALVCGLNPDYYRLYYTPLGDVMDIVALVNNAVNFVLYCATSRQFRTTFWSLVVRRKAEAVASSAVAAAGPQRQQKREC